jgi:trehalose 6-phosphate phosphatase
MAAAGCGKAFFIGDDVTDEDVFALKKGNIFTVKVGYDFRSGAGYFLRRQREIIRLLDFLSRACRHFA